VPLATTTTIATPAQRKKWASVAARSGSRTGGGRDPAAGRSAMWAKNIPPTHTTTPVTCSHNAIRMLERSAKTTILMAGRGARPSHAGRVKR
jgi:hypothetical protein